MQTSEALERIAYELAVDAAARRCALHRGAVLADSEHGQGLTSVRRSKHRCAASRAPSAKCGIVARIIVCALRTLSPAVSLEMAQLAREYNGHGVVGFDLPAREQEIPRRPPEAFSYAIEHDLA